MSADPGYRVTQHRVAVAGGESLRIRSLLDRLQYADPDGLAQSAGISPANWPLFGLLWPSAQKLADLMQRWSFGGRRILEIGCGLALASLVIHRRHGDITASDCHPLTESFLQANLALNRLPHLPYRTGHWQRINPLLGTFDLIVGSDVLYERDQPGQLADFVQTHAAIAAEVLIVDPNRGHRAAFSRSMRLLGFALSESLLESPLDDGTPFRGKLLRYRRAG